MKIPPPYSAAAAGRCLLILLLFSPSCSEKPKLHDTTGAAAPVDSGIAPKEADASPKTSTFPAAVIGHTAEGQFKKALFLLEKDRPQEAAPILQGLEGKMGAVTDHHEYYLSKALLALKKPVEARKHLQQLDGIKDSRLRKHVPEMTAEALYMEEKYEEAIALIEGILEKASTAKRDRAGLYLMLARSCDKAQRPLKAKEAYAQIIKNHPHAKKSREALEEYTMLVPGFSMSDAWRARRVDAYEKERMFNQALDEMRLRKTPQDKSEKDAFLFAKASLLYQARKSYKEALGILMQLMARKSSFTEQSILLAAKCKRRMGDIQGARTLFQLYLKRYPGSKNKSEVLLALLRFDMQEGRWNFITKNYKKFHTKKTFLGPQARRTVQWALGFSYFLTGDPIAAGDVFKSLKSGAGDRMELMKADYWYGVMLQQRGMRSSAVKIYKALVQKYPLHYYSVMSIIRLKELGESVAILPLPTEDKKPEAAAEPCELLPEKIQMLIRMELMDDARAEIEHEKSAILKNYANDPDKLLRVFECTGTRDIMYRALRGKYNKYTTYFPYKDILSYWKILYPSYRMEEAGRVSGEHGVPAYLTLSIIRQESSFNPAATSPSGAMGLMQLMPKTSEHIARLIDEPYDRESLYTAETNMRYGVYYISRLIDKFDGNTALAVGGYNGGPHNMAAWLRFKWTDRLDLFVELIPFEQTRNYIRRVTTSLTRYHYLYDGTIDPVIDILSKKTTTKIKKEPSF